MDRRLGDLEARLNLYSDDYYENFRDVLTDNAVKDSTTVPISPGDINCFGNGCSLEAISNSPVDLTQNQNFLSKVIKPWGWELNTLKLVHSCFLLHMQAEVNIKIDIIWTLDPTNYEDHPFDYSPIAVFFEDSGEGIFDEGVPNFEPVNNGYWDEFQFYMGIGPDPYPDNNE